MDSTGGRSTGRRAVRAKVLAEAIKVLAADYRADEWPAIEKILQKAGLTLQYQRPVSLTPTHRKDRVPVPNDRSWELVCYLFGVRSKADLEAVLDLADLERRIDHSVPDQQRDRLDSRVRRLALREKITAPDATYRPPFRMADLEPLVSLVNLAPLRLSRWYVARLISELHRLSWEGSDAERRRARALGERLGKAVIQPLGKGKRPSFSIPDFRQAAALYESLKGDAFSFSKHWSKGLSTRKDALNNLLQLHPAVSAETLGFLLDLARSSQIRTPRSLVIAALRKQFGIHSDSYVYRRMRLT